MNGFITLKAIIGAGIACALGSLLAASSGPVRGGASAIPNAAQSSRTLTPVAVKRPAATAYVWRNVNITAGGFVDGLIFSPVKKGLFYARTDIGGAYRWDERASRWLPLNDWAGGKDANLLGCESIGVDPVDGNRVYMAAGTYTQSWAGNGAILRSRDQGRTWQRTDMPFKMGGNEDGRSIGERLAVDPRDNTVLFFGSRHDGLWRSADYGATWSKVGTFPVTGRTNGVGIGFVVFEPRGGAPEHGPSQTIYVGVAVPGFGLCRSSDGGSSWTVVPGQPTGLLPHHAVPDGLGNLYITFGNAPGPNGMTDGAVSKFNLRTGAWTDVTPVKPGSPAGFGYAGLAVDMRNPRTIMVSTMDRWNPGDDVFRSTDGGAHWSPLRPKAVMDASLTPWLKWGESAPKFGWWIGALAIDPFAPGRVIYGTGATIWGSSDATAADAGKPTHWTVHAAGLEETAVITMISPPAGPHLISGLGDIGGFRHDDLLTTPRGMAVNPQIDNTDSLDFASTKPEIIVKAGRGKRGQNAAISQDGGARWSPLPAEPPNSQGGGSIAISSNGAFLVWAPAGGRISFSRDQGKTWTPCAGADGFRLTVLSDRVKASTFYLKAGDRLLASTDGGASFSPVAALPSGSKQLRASPSHAGELWLTAGSQGLYHSTDGGAHFERLTGVSDAGSIGFGKPSPGRDYPTLYLTCQTPQGESGVFQSDDTGENWIRLNDSQHQFGWPGQIVEGDPRVYGRVYLGTNGRGIIFGEPMPH